MHNKNKSLRLSHTQELDLSHQQRDVFEFCLSMSEHVCNATGKRRLFYLPSVSVADSLEDERLMPIVERLWSYVTRNHLCKVNKKHEQRNENSVLVIQVSQGSFRVAEKSCL